MIPTIVYILGALALGIYGMKLVLRLPRERAFEKAFQQYTKAHECLTQAVQKNPQGSPEVREAARVCIDSHQDMVSKKPWYQSDTMKNIDQGHLEYLRSFRTMNNERKGA